MATPTDCFLAIFVLGNLVMVWVQSPRNTEITEVIEAMSYSSRHFLPMAQTLRIGWNQESLAQLGHGPKKPCALNLSSTDFPKRRGAGFKRFKPLNQTEGQVDEALRKEETPIIVGTWSAN